MNINRLLPNAASPPRPNMFARDEEVEALIASAATLPATKRRASPPLAQARTFHLPSGRLHQFLVPERLGPLLNFAALTRVRKNQKKLSATEWQNLIAAINAIALPDAQAPTYGDFVALHAKAMDDATGMTWGAHKMPGMSDGRNFLSWHRELLAKFEARLQLVNPTVVLPYWDWTVDHAIPVPLTDPALVAAWGIARAPALTEPLPLPKELKNVNKLGVSPPSFALFQNALEGGPHNRVHRAIGGTMVTSSSPADPVFWLHHAMVDKVWADWEALHKTSEYAPPNLTEQLKEKPIMTRKVSDVLDTAPLGYVYG